MITQKPNKSFHNGNGRLLILRCHKGCPCAKCHQLLRQVFERGKTSGKETPFSISL